MNSNQPRVSTTYTGSQKAQVAYYRGNYSKQLRRIWSVFPGEQTLVLKSADLMMRQDALESVRQFLNVDRLPALVPLLENQGAYVNSMDLEDWVFLEALYRDEFAELEQLLNWDCGEWRNPPARPESHPV